MIRRRELSKSYVYAKMRAEPRGRFSAPVFGRSPGCGRTGPPISYTIQDLVCFLLVLFIHHEIKSIIWLRIPNNDTEVGKLVEVSPPVVPFRLVRWDLPVRVHSVVVFQRAVTPTPAMRLQRGHLPEYCIS